MRLALFIPAFILLSTAALAVSVDSVSAPDTIDLSGTRTSVNCSANISDTDGWEDINAIEGRFFDSASAVSNSADDNNDHYTNTSCVFNNFTVNDIAVVCTFDLWYYANPSDWTCVMNATDGSEASGISNSSVINTFLSLSVDALSFPLASLGNLSEEVELTITNIGNVDLDIELNSTLPYAMVCDSGSVPLSNLRFDVFSGTDFSSMTPVSQTLYQIPSFTIPQRTDDLTASTGSLYWRLSIPASGVGGDCSGGLNIDAV